MAEPSEPEKAKLVIGLMYHDADIAEKTVELLEEKFGPIDCQSKDFDFIYTDYYEKEFGENLKKRFCTFKNLIEPSELPEIKLFTNKLEGDERLINIDPGYITKDALVLASCKPRPHRIYLDRGVYAQLEMVFRKRECVFFRWTFKDYLENSDFFLKARNLFLK